jgi:hypothetical protein
VPPASHTLYRGAKGCISLCSKDGNRSVDIVNRSGASDGLLHRSDRPEFRMFPCVPSLFNVEHSSSPASDTVFPQVSGFFINYC